MACCKESEVLLPCDSERWPEMCLILQQLLEIKHSHVLVDKLHELQDLVRDDDGFRKNKVFNGLWNFLNAISGSEECGTFYDQVFPCVIKRALSMEHFKPEGGLLFSNSQTGLCKMKDCCRYTF